MHPYSAHLPSGKRLQGAGDARHRPAMCTGVHEQVDNAADSVPCDRLPLVRKRLMLPAELLASGCISAAAEAHCLLRLYVQPRASRSSFGGIHDHSLKLRITAPPVDNKANAMVIAFVAKKLQIPKSNISIVSGQQSRQKTLQVCGIEANDAAAALAALM